MGPPVASLALHPAGFECPAGPEFELCTGIGSRRHEPSTYCTVFKSGGKPKVQYPVPVPGTGSLMAHLAHDGSTRYGYRTGTTISEE